MYLAGWKETLPVGEVTYTASSWLSKVYNLQRPRETLLVVEGVQPGRPGL
jgi:hypothetical protein